MQNSEYYNAKILADAGWPVIQPIFMSTTPGSQFVVYDHIDAPTAFSAYEEQEDRLLAGGAYDKAVVDKLLQSERTLGKKIREAYLGSLELSECANIEMASLFQIFYRRLVATGEPTRLQNYYIGKDVQLPNGKSIPFNELSKKKWTINGVRYQQTLEEIIAKAKDLLDPSKEERVATVIGHGDDHNGNRFIISNEYVLFDPAFAGRQPALLSYIKATAHNVFVHPQWLYDPQKLEKSLKLMVSIDDEAVTVDYNWSIEKLSPLRLQILDIYKREVWKPLIQELADRKLLPPYWKDYIRAALFCCPFLVMDLIDGSKYSPAQTVLALSKCVELGSKTGEDTVVERFLKDIAPKNI